MSAAVAERCQVLVITFQSSACQWLAGQAGRRVGRVLRSGYQRLPAEFLRVKMTDLAQLGDVVALTEDAVKARECFLRCSIAFLAEAVPGC